MILHSIRYVCLKPSADTFLTMLRIQTVLQTRCESASSLGEESVNSREQARRSYPQTSYITQTHLSTLLLSSPSLQSLPAPATTTEVPTNSSSIAPSASGGAERVIAATTVPSLSSILEKIPTGQGFVGAGLHTGTGEGAGAMPPRPPGFGKRWVPMAGEDIPKDEHAYFPMIGYK